MKRILSKLLLICFMAAMVFAFAACGSSSTQSSSQEAKKTVVMGTNAEFKPFEYREGGKVIGIDADIAAAIAKDMGTELKIEDMSFDSLIGAVSTGKVDFVAAGMTVTDERKKNVDFSDPYYDAGIVIVVKDGSAITGKKDLENKKIAVQQGTTSDEEASKIKTAQVSRFSKFVDALTELNNGKADCVIMDLQTAQSYLKEMKGLKILPEKLTEEQYAIAVKKGNSELLGKINATLKKLKDSGELEKIYKNYEDK